MSKHTPGPWSIITDDDCPIEISVDGSDSDSGQVVSQWVVVESETHAGFLAAVIDMNYPNSFDCDKLQANARLIAAAPTLLAAAEKALNFFVGTPVLKEARDVQAALEAAIAAATGEV